jgi:hypothetical protein
LERLDQEYQESLNNLLRQKADAKRWLLRQQIRLTSQCEEVKREKAAVSSVLNDEYSELNALLNGLQEMMKKSRATTTLHQGCSQDGYNKTQEEENQVKSTATDSGGNNARNQQALSSSSSSQNLPPRPQSQSHYQYRIGMSHEQQHPHSSVSYHSSSYNSTSSNNMSNGNNGATPLSSARSRTYTT